ncbi:MAG: DUF4011 domain-containing protein [Terriglobia bacterium]
MHLSPEFLAKSTEAGLEKIRTRLLDLTSRNRLLNFRHTSASSLRVVGVNPNVVFHRLSEGEKLVFLPVPEPDRNADQKPSAVDHAKSIGWPTSFDLDDVGEVADETTLPVLHYVEHLETLTRKIGSAAKTAIEESGANMLYLVLGFLEWYESEDSDQSRFAPLLTVPVSLDRSAGRGAAFQCAIEYSGEDLATNLSLVERMRRDFGLEIPVLDGDDTLEEYLARFQPIFPQKRRWRIRRQVTLTLLSFGKLLMYRDLDPTTWPAIIRHPLVKELFEGRKSDTVTQAEEFAIDAPELKPEVPQLILDADSSQHSALIHALRGQNLVIEGPPGTGKSQTITNLIGAALAKGKTVLFVAEKLAALQVVRKRLGEAGLGIFCLELHSNKTKKHALLNDLADRLKVQGGFREPKELENMLAELEKKKQFLTQYAAEINRRIQPFDATVFEILWARDRYQRELPFTLAGNVPNALGFTREQYDHKEDFLSGYAQHLSAVLQISPDLVQHPWVWLDTPLSFEQEERLLDLLADALGRITPIFELAAAIESHAGIVLARRLSEIDRMKALLDCLPKDVPISTPRLLAACLQIEVLGQVRLFVQDVRVARDALQAVGRLAINVEEFLASDAKVLTDAFEMLGRLALLDDTVKELRSLLLNLKTAYQKLSEAQNSMTAMKSLLGCEVEFDTRSIEFLLCCVRLLDNAPIAVLHLRSESLERDGIPPILRAATEESERINALASDLSSVFNLATTDPDCAAELFSHAKTLEDAGILQILFSSSVRAAKRSYAKLATCRNKRHRREIARELRTLGEYLQKRTRFERESLYRSTFGSYFKGAETNWGEIQTIVGWYEQVFAGLPEHERSAEPFRTLLLRGRSDRLKAVRSSLVSQSKEREVLSGVQTVLQAVSTNFPLAGSTSQPLSSALQNLQTVMVTIETIINGVSAAGYREDAPLSQIPMALSARDRYRLATSRVDAQGVPQKLLGSDFHGLRTELEPIEQADRFAQRIVESGAPPAAVNWILSENQSERLAQLRSWLAQAVSGLEELSKTVEAIRELSQSQTWLANGPAGSLDTCFQICTRSLESRDQLPQWVHFLRVRVQSKEEETSKLTALADARRMEADHLVPAFRFLFYDSLARGIFAERPALSGMAGLTTSETRKQFARLDRETIALYRQRVAAIIDHRYIPSGSQSGPVGFWTDLALVIHEINKQRRHIPIRQLMRRAGGALLALKPCFMMGPLSVAQYLVPGELSFDLIVMDEASQLKPEDAVGALARGGQMVIVGDPKQLPPTTFFQRAAMDAETEDDDQTRTGAEEGESILDVASTLYQPVRRLRWHYRSRHHSLIAFSNKEFYQGDLVIFPSAYHERSDLGVKYHPVRGGMFENGRNAREAANVVDAVMDHMERRPEESLGVVTLNFEQGELIEEMLDQRLRSEPFALAYQEKMNSGSEPFFVKNLENVQGDERDVIFISATYGPDARGNQYQRFGPLNGANGHRRLNVLFTRAKKRTEVFSSLEPDKIQTGPGSAWGLRALKQYLIFARSGILETADEGSQQATNDFERCVGAVLKERSFEVVPQVGVAGFFIDLAVKHPTKAGSYLLGIECDGASYHSGRSARDRDRLREEILVNLGWKIHRIWSTDWFKSRSAEIDRLMRRVQEILAADPDYRMEQTKQARTESLRQALIRLRHEIDTEFPSSPPEKRLLRDELLEELMLRRPKSRDDWFRLVSQRLRMETEVKQVGRYLLSVLQAIAEASS